MGENKGVLVLWGRVHITLIEHLLELRFGVAFESDKLNAESMVPLPANRCDGNVDRVPRTGQVNMYPEVGTDLSGQIRFDLTTGNGEIGHRPGSAATLTAQRDRIVYFDPRPTPFMHIETPSREAQVTQ